MVIGKIKNLYRNMEKEFRENKFNSIKDCVKKDCEAFYNCFKENRLLRGMAIFNMGLLAIIGFGEIMKSELDPVIKEFDVKVEKRLEKKDLPYSFFTNHKKDIVPMVYTRRPTIEVKFGETRISRSINPGAGQNIVRAKNGSPIFKKEKPRENPYQKVERISKKDFQTVIDSLDTPFEAEIYCRCYLGYKGYKCEKNISDSLAFSKIHERKATDCKGGTVSPAAILSDDGYEPLGLSIKPKNGDYGHIVFVYKNEYKGHCSIGINYCDNKWNRKSLENLAKEIAHDMYGEGSYTCRLVDLSKLYPNYKK